MIHKINRRNFLQIGSLTGTGLLLGFPLVAGKEQSAPTVFAPSAFLSINSDGSIILWSKNPEIGQGVKTSLPMIIAEELEVEWEQIEVRQAGYNRALGSQYAGGSTAVKSNWETLRKAGASARAMLIQAAAAQWRIAASDCYAQSAKVFNNKNGEALDYADLAEAASLLEVPENPPLKSPGDFRIIGTEKKNVDSLAIVTGQPIFGLDAKPKGAKVAAIAKCPVLGGVVKSFDSEAALAIPGVEQVVEIEAHDSRMLRLSGVAVIARNTWAAMKGKKALQIEWETGEDSKESSSDLKQRMEKAINEGGETVLRSEGDVESAFANADRVIEATYQVPFLAHVPMEPINYFADVTADSITCAGATQMPGGAPYYGSQLFGISRENITVEINRTGGGFGRRLLVDYTMEAMYLSEKTGQPIQVVWSREDDVQHDYYRPMGMYKLKGALDADGNITAWQIDGATTSRYLFRGADSPPHKTELFPDGFPAGFIANFNMRYTPIVTKVPTGAWRAPGHNATCFVDQSFLDELAVAAGKDPIDLRLELLGEEDKTMPYDDHGGPNYSTARLRTVIEKVAEISDWRQPPAEGRYRGFAAHFMFGAYVAEVVEISINSGKRPKVERVFAAVDCGIVVNQLGAMAQIEGGIVDGLGATLYGEITIDQGAVAESNFHNYHMLRFPESPEVIISLIESEESPEGLGEISLPPVNAALCNALFRATGKRLRSLPLKNSEVFVDA